MTPADRGQRLVEPGEAVAHPSLRHQREPAVGQGPHLQIRVPVLERDLQGPVGALQQVIDIGTGARQEGDLEPPVLDARPDPVEKAARPSQPSLPGGHVPE